MTFEQAVLISKKTGRKFRLPSMTKNRWYYVDNGYIKFIQEPSGDMGGSSGLAEMCYVSDVLSNQWELEELVISLTKSDLIKIIKLVKKDEITEDYYNKLLMQLGYE